MTAETEDRSMTRARDRALEAAREFQRLGAPERRAVLDMMGEMQRGVRLTTDEWLQWGTERAKRCRADGAPEMCPADA